VIDSLNDNGVMLMQKTHEVENGVMIETVFLHESGEELSAGKLFMPATKIDAQGFGSALSYARRYSLMAACGIAPEDDDANTAVRSAPVQQAKAIPKPQADVPVAKPSAPVQENNISKPSTPVSSQEPAKAPSASESTLAPPKMQGKADQWQLKVSTDPGTDFAQWAEMVKDATVFMLEMAQTKDDTMNIFRTNRNIYDKLQADDLASYDALTNIFKSYKEKL
jgi:hypothetical protein